MNRNHLAQRITATLFVAQSLGSAGFIAVATVGSIAGAQLSGRPSLAGAPSGVYLLGSAFAAWLWGQLMDRLGRRNGLALGLLVGCLGAAIAVGALVAQSFSLFLLGAGLMGMAFAALQLGRFAAAEVSPPEQRGRAISSVVLGGTLGAIFGPTLVGPTGRWAEALGVDELAGPYAAAFGLLLLAAGVILVFLRPDPRDLGREVARSYPAASAHPGEARSISQILRLPAARLAISGMVIGQVVMVMLMVITALHMKSHGHPLTNVSLVISSHTFGMYAFSIFSGRLADRLGRVPVLMAGAATLALASLLAPLSPQLLPLGFALFLLGLGWNFCYVGGSALLADQLSPAERARTQGFNDLLIGSVSALGSLGSGLVFAGVGYGVMGIAAAAVSVLALLLSLGWLWGQRRTAGRRATPARFGPQ
ncbi:MAG TPA: MFS transporter [Anaerolineales bacterium]|nr:MFS transporter [Anaerolineales bacterium]